ncbi:MAG: cytochrome c biogenesis protein CcdA [Pseudomonadota bacterium]
MLVLSFFAGLLTILNPCVLPLVPVVVAGAAASSRAGPAALAAGLAISFAVSGTALAAVGIEFGSWWPLRAAAAILLFAAGLALMIPALSARLAALAAPAAGLAGRWSERLPAGALGQFAAGALLGLAWAPCIGPTLGAVFALAATGASRLEAALAMSVFALGAGLSLLALGYGLRRITRGGRSRMAGVATAARRMFGAALALIAILILTGLDKMVEGAMVQALPDWFVTLATRL